MTARSSRADCSRRLLMWDGGPAPPVRLSAHQGVEVSSTKAASTPTAAGQLHAPADVWEHGRRTDAGATVDPFVVELTAARGRDSHRSGPRSRSTIAQATLKGSIYYNSYSSIRLAAGLGGTRRGGAVLRIPRGKSAEGFLGMTGCTGCHSVSANGERMVALPLIGPALAGTRRASR